MTTRLKWLLWVDATLLLLLAGFVSNLALVLPVRPAVEYWGLAWPLFAGDGDIRIPDGVVYASFCAFALTAAVLVIFALTAAANRIRAMVVRGGLGVRG